MGKHMKSDIKDSYLLLEGLEGWFYIYRERKKYDMHTIAMCEKHSKKENRQNIMIKK